MKDNPKRNSEGYLDPTPYEAIKSIEEKEANERFSKFISLLYKLCELCGYHIEERIVVKDVRTGKIWR